MAFETDDKTEPATPRKRQESRERGQVAKSTDLGTALILLAACLALHFFGLPGVEKMGAVMTRILEQMSSFHLGIPDAVHIMGVGFFLILEVLLPLLVIIFAVAVAANMFQIGFLVSSHPVTPDVGRLNPLKGFGRIFSSRGVFRGAFGFLKVLAISSILFYTLRTELIGSHSSGVILLLTGSLHQGLVYMIQLAVELGLRAVVVILILGILDYGIQRWHHERDLRMTKSEVKEEMRRMEGDPKMKERRRRTQQQLAYQRMMQEVPKANVVVTNPTHVAVAIRYEQEEMAAPRMVAKGEGYIAHRIRQVAMEHGIPVVERRALARSLFEAVEIGQEIPPEFFKAVAELLAFVYRMSGEPASRSRLVGSEASSGEGWR